jgi:two-component system, chemotaxis family, sensor kinase CheA
MSLDHALETFLNESRELLVDMERILLELEANPDEAELRNALFRCVHTVKGSAGMFGLDHVVSFTHVVENVLDRLRAKEIQFNSNLAHLLLRSRDHIAALVEILNIDEAADLEAEGNELLAELKPFQADKVTEKNETASESTGIAGQWHLSIRIQKDALRHGMDPLGFIRFLETLGELLSITTVSDALPPLDSIDPESCFLGFEIELRTKADRVAIEDVFEFAGDLYDIRMIPPNSGLDEYIELLESLPEGAERLGEILVASGALSRNDLDTCLQVQETAAWTEQGKPLGEIMVEQGVIDREKVGAALAKQEQVRRNGKKRVHHLRIQADKLDKLINFVGELVIASATVALNASRSGDAETQESAANLTLLVEEIRDSALDLRMVPIGDTFQRFQRVLRDISSELGKDIQLVITGADTELDKTVVEKIGDPLTHLVRNACDHGIESPEIRRGKGKPAKGSVHLNAFHESGAIVIEVSDDGGGLDRDRILDKAMSLGLVKEDTTLSDQEIHNLIFEPGFSTVDQVTNLSGRGVGMDVVRRNIESLRGVVEVLSPGTKGGTTFRIRLPLTLAIIDGFLARVGESTYVVPLEMVAECTELDADQSKINEHQHYINLRDEVLPLIWLKAHFCQTGEAGRRQNIIVVNHGGQKAGLVVDDLLGEHQTVIKPLSSIFTHLKGVSGSTILGNGQVALILDVPALMQQTVQREDAANRVTQSFGATPSH